MQCFTLHDLLEQSRERCPGNTAVITGDEAVSYAQLYGRVQDTAAWLIKAGVRPGDRVVIHLNKGVEEIVAMLAATRSGAVFVNANYHLAPPQLSHLLRDSGARVLIADAGRLRRLRDSRDACGNNLEYVLVRGKPPQAAAGRGDIRMAEWSRLPRGQACPPVRRIGEDLATLFYTSGSTGMPKGVMTTHANLLNGARSVVSYLRNTDRDRVLSLLPMSFDYGFSQLTTMFLVGGCVVLQGVMMPVEIVKTIMEHHVTGLALVPPAWIPLLRHLDATGIEIASLRYVTNSGGRIPQPFLEMMPRVFPRAEIFLMYGLTEAFRSTYLAPEQFVQKMGSIGKAIPNEEVYVVSEEHGLCGPGQTGELVHRGSLVSRGYWNDTAATAAKIRVCPSLVSLIGDEKVLYSGDRVRWDDDGILWFVGRADGMIKCSGFRVSPTEVEEILYASGAIIEAVVYGSDDVDLGQVVHAAVATEEDTDLDIAALEAHCRRAMPDYMRPRWIYHYRGGMPKTANGKIDVPEVIRRASIATPGPDPET